MIEDGAYFKGSIEIDKTGDAPEPISTSRHTRALPLRRRNPSASRFGQAQFLTAPKTSRAPAQP